MLQTFSLRALIAALLMATCAIDTWAADQRHPKTKKPAKALAVTPDGPSYAQRTDVLQAADDIAQARNLDIDWVRQTLAQARYIPAVAKAVTPPPAGVAKNWAAYRERFIESRRIRAGVAFWLAHRDTLQRAERQTGVPPEIIVGIIGVETLYGQHMGNYRVLDALATLAFDFPVIHPRAAERAAYFRGELAQYLNLMARTGRDPTSLRGSYAGAMGLPQFMPTSWAKYAVDFDGDSQVDLFASAADAIGSVAEYFKAFGWQPGLATHFPVSFDATRLNMEALLAADILPTFSVASFQANGALLEGDALTHTGKLALIELQMGTAPPIFVAGTDNFYAITRYNWSSYYALAVIELGLAVRQAMESNTDTRRSVPHAATHH